MSRAENVSGPACCLVAGNFSTGTHVFAPPQAAMLIAGAAGSAAFRTARFEVHYNNFSPQARASFQAALDVWSVLVRSPVPIRINATWAPLGGNSLGTARAPELFQNFPHAPVSNVHFCGPLACRLSGADLAPGDAHIEATFNSSLPNWHFGTGDAAPNDRYDLMTAVIHEIGHGLGLDGTGQLFNTGNGGWGVPQTGRPAIYDVFIRNVNGQRLLDTGLFPNPSPELGGQLRSARLFFDGPNVRAANNGAPAQIFAPHQWIQGSSYSHLDEVRFPSGGSSSLMSPQLAMGETIHSPGPVGMAMLADIGW